MLGVGTSGPVARAPATGTASTTGAPADGIGPDPYAGERDAWTVLSVVDGLGPVAFAALLARFGSARAIVAAAGDPGALERLADTPAQDRRPGRRVRRPVPPGLALAIVDAADDGHDVLERVRALDIRVVTMEEPAYPARLAAIAMPPHVLYVRGATDALARHAAVAVVGTRRPTAAGRATTGRIAAALVAADATVVSGLAYGVDGAAHEATIRADGTTVAVIGGGHAVAIPPGHRRLADAILAAGGAVVSELGPDVQPTHGTFPRRNRIISGLADATVVVEAPARSGALITASWALEQGRECYLVPGRLDDPASAGCLAFLREFHVATHIVAGIPQLIADLGLVQVGIRTLADGPAPDRLAAAALQDLGRTGQLVATGLLQGLATVDELVATTDLTVATVLAALGYLEHLGLAAGVHGRYRAAGPLLGEPPPPMPR